MADLDLPRSGVFFPDEVDEMVRGLHEGDKPGEPDAEREERARDIVERRDLLRRTQPDA